MDAGGAPPDARLRELLGDLELGGGDAGASAWADGFGIVAPDVQRYADVLLAVPDAVQLALRNMAAAEGVELLDPGATTLLGLLARSCAPARVLEVGTSIGHVTLHLARAVPPSCTIT
ncbi:MAG: O-methyltransferase family 3, partial [Thermoleophilia bacterium]|nr:O-methyltransferase family 3 [Thermoleophilia bacterium]